MMFLQRSPLLSQKSPRAQKWLPIFIPRFLRKGPLSQSGLTAREQAVAQHWTAAADMKLHVTPMLPQHKTLEWSIR